MESGNVAGGKYLGRKVHFSTPLGQPKFHEVSVCFPTALPKSFPKQDIMKFCNPVDQFKGLKQTIVEILCLDIFLWQNFINDDQNASVEIWSKFA